LLFLTDRDVHSWVNQLVATGCLIRGTVPAGVVAVSFPLGRLAR
jgi:hypothetical protein